MNTLSRDFTDGSRLNFNAQSIERATVRRVDIRRLEEVFKKLKMPKSQWQRLLSGGRQMALKHHLSR